MSLRFVGSQLLQTNPSPLLAGASTASLSIWVRVNNGSVITNTTGVELFGDVAGKLSVGLSAAGNLQVNWSSNNGSINGGSEWDQPVLPGVNYHLAVTWQDGSQNYYLNGLLVHSDVQPGTLGKMGDNLAHVFRLGSDLAGVDVSIDEPTLWVGYALTASDVVSLRDRVVQPGTIAPSSIALEWSLAGSDGASAIAGQGGLVDASKTGLNLTSVVGTAPSYQGGTLNYAWLDGGCSAAVAPSGEAVLFTFRDAATNFSNVTNLTSNNETQSVTLSGNPSGGHFTLSFQGQTTAPIAAQPAPPAVYVQWNVTVPSAGSYDLAVNMYIGANGSANVLYEVFDGSKALGSTTLNQAGNNGFGGGPYNPATFNDPTVQAFAGGPVVWYPLGRFTTASTSLSVRVSCSSLPPDRNAINVDHLRVASTDGSQVQMVSTAASSTTIVGYWTHNNTLGTQFANDPAELDTQGQGAGVRYVVNPSDVVAALGALSGVGPTNIIATGNASVVTPMKITFVGALGGSSQPLMTATDPLVAIHRIASGGLWPTIRINGGSPVPLSNPFAPVTGPPYMPTIVFPFVQDTPTAFYESIGCHVNTFASPGGGWSLTSLGYLSPGQPGYQKTGYSQLTRISSGPTPTASFPQQPIPPGTYRISATWPTDPHFATDVVYTITNAAGTVLGVYHTNQTIAPGGPMDQGVPWQILGSFTVSGIADGLTVTQSLGANGGQMMADTIRFERTSAPIATRVNPGDIVTYSAGSAWASSMVGPAPSTTNAPVNNLSGGSIFAPIPTTPQTMHVGWNLAQTYYFLGMFYYTNLMTTLNNVVGYANDADGNPILMAPSNFPSASIVFQLVQGPDSREADGKTWPNISCGDYTVMWDGTPTDDVTMDYATEYTSKAVITGGVGNKRVYSLSPASPREYGPEVWVRLHSTSKNSDNTFNCGVRNLRVYQNSSITNINNPPKFLPNFLSKLQGVKSLRFLDPLGAINGNPTTFDDYNPPQSRVSRYISPRNLVVPIAQISAYNSSSRLFDPYRGSLIQFKTATPHGFSEGQYVTLHNNPGVVQCSDGTSFDLSDRNYGYVHVVDPSTVVIQIGPSKNSGSPAVMTNVITAGTGYNACIQMQAGNGMPLADLVELCNTIGADIYVNISVSATDDCLASMGTFLAKNLNPGLKARFEYSNETWNFGSAPYSWMSANTYRYQLGDGSSTNYVPYYCEQANHVWNILKIAMTAQGRGGDMLRVLGTQHAYPAITANLVQYCKTQGITFDQLAVAPYLENQQSFAVGGAYEAGFASMADQLTVDQMLDFYEIYQTYGGWSKEVPIHRAYLNNAGFNNVEIITYEGGPDGMMVNGSSVRQGQRSHGVHRHPRFHDIMMNSFRIYQNTGVGLFQVFYLTGGDGPYGPFYQWSAYTGTDQLPGTGDPILDAANAQTPDRLDLIKSQTGGAVLSWAALASGSSSPTPNKPQARKLRYGKTSAKGPSARGLKLGK